MTTKTLPTNSSEPSYIDYEAFLSPTFSPHSFANTLVLATNNPSDSPLDLATPLSKVLFDIQEVNTHIDSLTARSAGSLLSHTRDQTDASKKIADTLEPQIKAVNDSYRQLEREVIERYEHAKEVRDVVDRLWHATRLMRAVSRALVLGRQLEAQFAELNAGVKGKEDHRALGRCVHTVLALRELFDGSAGTKDAGGSSKEVAALLENVTVIKQLKDSILTPVEKTVRETAERIIREFSVGTTTFAQSEDLKSRTISALTSLYLLSPIPLSPAKQWNPTFMLSALEAYLRSALQSSIASLSRALTNLPNLDRTLAEISARCQNILALETILDSTKPPIHPLLSTKLAFSGTLLQPLLTHLETGSLQSYFWRTLAANMAPRVQEIVNKGGAAARNLKGNRQVVGDALRECVLRGGEVPKNFAASLGLAGTGAKGDAGKGKSWDREVAVMVGSVVNNLGK
ncbi:uncharacterized protein CTHT_0049930 [Thermochaetoides thermophila DSM 1495]|uniref:Conserved oligomeric Golgi complex subunit 5 n=1 Tax=Chaetomium thermophilum (strain DSM 1495 / CBS 144.50 / IMI 039719) TaxID=759272 RepID=G0SBE0_CHATD|nr:hypothetical protein CTHT_0049930 [Thermochaetoides thermophila DSM 1495]EGS19520.1 hypothetical protein CTHT_0049930 [Thermochaetoides thermophila DSM 1495]